MTDARREMIRIVRLGFVQSAIGSIVVLVTSVLNRVMVVEMAVAASVPAALVALHYVVQVTRPQWGHSSDRGGRRTPWIVGGMGVLVLGALLATNSAIVSSESPTLGIVLGIIAYILIGGGVAACGTSLLALLASSVSPGRKPAAAATTWIMMILGIVMTAGITGSLLDPFSTQRLALVVAGVACTALTITLLATWGVEKGASQPQRSEPAADFRRELHDMWSDPLVRRFTIFVFVSMLAYSTQDMVMEPFAGLVFGFTIGESTKLAGVQHGGVLLGMLVAGGAARLKNDAFSWMRMNVILGCVSSALSLGGLAAAGAGILTLPLQPLVGALGFSNGIFAVCAIGLMMSFAGEGKGGREGIRIGLWGAAQAIAFALGGFLGAAGLDALRSANLGNATAFASVFIAEAALFLVAAAVASSLGQDSRAAIPHHASAADASAA